jgi:WD40 repeat protein
VIASGGFDKTVRLWDLQTGELTNELPSAHAGPVYSVAMEYLNGQPIDLSGGYDGTVRLGDSRACTPLGKPLSGYRKPVHSVVLGRVQEPPVIISGGADKTVRVWRPDGSASLVIAIGSPALATALARPSLAILATLKGIMALQLHFP